MGRSILESTLAGLGRPSDDDGGGKRDRAPSGAETLAHSTCSAGFEPGEALRSPVRGRFWILCERQSRTTTTRRPALSIGEASGGVAAVFSSKQEAGEFFSSRVPEGEWWIRELRAEEGSPAVDALLGGYERVALDPPPEIAERAMDDLVSVSRREFVERLAVGADSFSDGTDGAERSALVPGGRR